MLRKLLFCIFCLTFLLNYTVPILANIYEMPQLNATSAVLIDADSGIILYEKNPHKTLYPASITKLMTALLLLEHVGDDLNQRIYMSNYAVFSIPFGASHIAMDEGETLTASQALYAIMLESANEVSNAIAEHIAGDVNTFSLLMTQRARELGALNTNFKNAHGLHHPQHYSTAYDMSLITRELLRFPYFINVINTRSFNIPPTERQPLERPLNNTHRMIHPGQFFHPYTVGGKTGFTNQASHTLSTYARNYSAGLVAIVMENIRHASYSDTINLLNFGFSLFENTNHITIDSIPETLNVVQLIDGVQINIGSANMVPLEPVSLNLPQTITLEDLQFNLDIPNYIMPPISIGQIIGKLAIMYGNMELASVDLISQNEFMQINETNATSNSPDLGYGLLNINYFASSIVAFLYNIFSLRNILIVTSLTSLLILLIRITRFVRYIIRKKRRRNRVNFHYSKINKNKTVRGSTRYKYRD